MDLPKHPRYPFLTGFESTHIHGTGRDVLDGTQHIARWKSDLNLVKAAGVTTLRYPVPWHRIERRRGWYDWQWMDAVLAHMQALGLEPIVDPIHHTSFPDWIEGGFAHPQFADLYHSFVEAFARRYPWVTKYTIFNEPFVTTLFCGRVGIWYPRLRDARSFARMVAQVGQAICRTTHTLERLVPGLELLHVDTCEHHVAVDPRFAKRAEFQNNLRFLFHDLILGRIAKGHPLHAYLLRQGLTRDELAWFRDHPARIDVLGLDYYPHSEHQLLTRGIRFVSTSPRGFAEVAGDYVERYGLPVMLSETNIKGLVSDRLSWMKHMVEECDKLVGRGVDFRGFCWFPFVDSTDWCSLVCRAEGTVDPVGIYWLDSPRRERHASELSECFGRLARGEMTAADLPAYRFQRPWTRTLRGFSRFTSHWDWKEPEVPSRRKTRTAVAELSRTG